MISSSSETPFTNSNVYKGEKMEDKTRVDFDSEPTRIEGLTTLSKNEKGEGRGALAGWLAILEGDLQGEAFHLYQGRNTMGSSFDCDLKVPDEGVQGQHSSIRFSGGKWTLTDLDSDGGTFLNGKRIYRSELKDGDRVKLGKALLAVKIL